MIPHQRFSIFNFILFYFFFTYRTIFYLQQHLKKIIHLFLPPYELTIVVHHHTFITASLRSRSNDHKHNCCTCNQGSKSFAEEQLQILEINSVTIQALAIIGSRQKAYLLLQHLHNWLYIIALLVHLYLFYMFYYLSVLMYLNIIRNIVYV